MLESFFSIGMQALAGVTPISIAATNIVFFPLVAVWLFGRPWTFSTWPPRLGMAEKIFALYLLVSLMSAIFGLSFTHSLKEIKNKDLYLILVVTIVALVKDRMLHQKMLRYFLWAGLLMALWGLIQYAVGVNQSDKSEGFFYSLPPALKSWPRPVLDTLSLVNGRVIGTRSHPLTYAECLLFTWAFCISKIISVRGQTSFRWILSLALTGGGLLVSQSRGPWIAAAAMLILGILIDRSTRSWYFVLIALLFLGLFRFVPSLHTRVVSIADSTHHSNRDRLHMWQAGIWMWKWRPFLGIGPGNVVTISHPYQEPGDRPGGPWGHLHNNYINGLAERGALGLFAFLAFFLALFKEIWDYWRRTQDPYASMFSRAALLSLVGFGIGGLTETSYNSAVVKMMLFFVIGMALALVRHDPAK